MVSPSYIDTKFLKLLTFTWKKACLSAQIFLFKKREKNTTIIQYFTNVYVSCFCFLCDTLCTRMSSHQLNKECRTNIKSLSVDALQAHSKMWLIHWETKQRLQSFFLQSWNPQWWRVKREHYTTHDKSPVRDRKGPLAFSHSQCKWLLSCLTLVSKVLYEVLHLTFVTSLLYQFCNAL